MWRTTKETSTTPNVHVTRIEAAALFQRGIRNNRDALQRLSYRVTCASEYEIIRETSYFYKHQGFDSKYAHDKKTLVHLDTNISPHKPDVPVTGVELPRMVYWGTVVSPIWCILWLSSAVWPHKDPWRASSCATAVLAHWVGYRAFSRWTLPQEKYTDDKVTGRVSHYSIGITFLFECMCVCVSVCASVPSQQICAN